MKNEFKIGVFFLLALAIMALSACGETGNSMTAFCDASTHYVDMLSNSLIASDDGEVVVNGTNVIKFIDETCGR